eukprot:COSAG02_NODE_27577_length_606_cov_1.429980_1_plen_171_part_01
MPGKVEPVLLHLDLEHHRQPTRMPMRCVGHVAGAARRLESGHCDRQSYFLMGAPGWKLAQRAATSPHYAPRSFGAGLPQHFEFGGLHHHLMYRPTGLALSGPRGASAARRPDLRLSRICRRTRRAETSTLARERRELQREALACVREPVPRRRGPASTTRDHAGLPRVPAV